MTKTLSKLRIATFVLFLFQILGVAAALIMWIFMPDFSSAAHYQQNVLYILVGFVVFVVTDAHC